MSKIALLSQLIAKFLLFSTGAQTLVLMLNSEIMVMLYIVTVKLSSLMHTRNSIRLISIRFDSIRFESSESSNTLSIRKFFLVFDSIRFDSISIWYALNSRVSLYSTIIMFYLQYSML